MPNLRFAAPVENRVALITGGAQGIGRATALRLAEAGRNIAIADVAPGADETIAAIESLGRHAAAYPVDVTDPAAVQQLVRDVLAAFGRLDILVCCAGVLGREHDFLELPAAEFERVLRVNVFGVFHCHQAVLPIMVERGWGRCLTIGSGARYGSSKLLPYSVSKGALHSFISSLGGAYAAQGVFVNGLVPGRVLTQMVVPRFSAEYLANPPGVPVGRYADPEEIAEVIEYLTSERNTYTSGVFWDVQNNAR